MATAIGSGNRLLRLLVVGAFKHLLQHERDEHAFRPKTKLLLKCRQSFVEADRTHDLQGDVLLFHDLSPTGKRTGDWVRSTVKRLTGVFDQGELGSIAGAWLGADGNAVFKAPDISVDFSSGHFHDLGDPERTVGAWVTSFC